MINLRPQRSRSCHPGLEALEPRRVPAQLGIPWQDAKHLTISFVPDGTPIAAHRSGLFQTLDAQQPTATWQREILQAFQTWAVQANINFAVVPDGGQPLGDPGPDQGDPRFGDIRIGAQPMSPEVLSISVPHDPFLSGTWSGDILLNSTVPFDGQDVALSPVLLHEVGHALGFDDSLDPSSVMFSHLNNDQVSLSPGDVNTIQALYGPRHRDPFEGGGGNDSIATAAAFRTPAGFDGTTPLLLYANLSTPTDVDDFSLRPPDGYGGPVTIRLQTAGVSLLAPRLTVLDGSGRVLDDVASVSDVGDTLQVSLPQVDPGATYFVQVRGATDDVFGIGEYVLAASFDARTTIGPDAIDTLARQSYSYLAPDDIDAIFRNPQGALFRDDHHADDRFATADPLPPIGAYGSMAPDRITASLGDPTDVDVYHVETPEVPDDGSDQPLVMTVTVRATEVNGIMPGASVFDEDQNPVPATVLAHGDGTYRIQVDDARPDSDYYVLVRADPTSGKVVGNYDLEVDYGRIAASPVTFVNSTLSGGVPDRTYLLAVNRTQLFDFLLTANTTAADPDTTVRMTIDDGAGRSVATRPAGDGNTVGGDPVLLVPGIYRVTFAAEAHGGVGPSPLAFRLYGASLSDPIGPALDDPTLRPFASPTSVDPTMTIPPLIGSAREPYTWLALALSPRIQRDVSLGPGHATEQKSVIPLAVQISTAPNPDRVTVRPTGSAVSIERDSRFGTLLDGRSVVVGSGRRVASALPGVATWVPLLVSRHPALTSIDDGGTAAPSLDQRIVVGDGSAALTLPGVEPRRDQGPGVEQDAPRLYPPGQMATSPVTAPSSDRPIRGEKLPVDGSGTEASPSVQSTKDTIRLLAIRTIEVLWLAALVSRHRRQLRQSNEGVVA